MARLTIGVHIGSTTTNAVILQGRELIAKAKHPTRKNNAQEEFRPIVENVIDNFVASKPRLTRNDVINCTGRITVGVSHFMNALLERKGLSKVGVIRLCGSATRALPPFVDHPEHLQQKINGGYGFVRGGFECTKKEISSLIDEEIAQKVEELWSKSGVRNFVVSGVYSPLDHSQECQAASIIRNVYPEASITESHLFSYCGLLERENAAILNESLKPLSSDLIGGLRRSLDDIGFPENYSFYLTQNDGNLIREEMVKKLPLLTVLSGPASSMRGAAFLSGTDDAVVVDIGEITTNVGMVKSGLPCMSNDCFKLSGVGVRAKFYHPIMKSISLGKGSIISRSDSNNETVLVEPKDDGHRLSGASSVATATDVAMAIGVLAPVGTSAASQTLDCRTAYAASMEIYKKIGEAIDAVKTSPQDPSVLLVGDGSVLVDTDNWTYRGVKTLQRTAHYDVADAVGAAVGQISGEYQEMVAVSSKLTDNVDHLIERCITKAKDNAIANGASQCSLRVVEKHVDPETGIYIKVIGNPKEDFKEEVTDMQTEFINDDSEFIPKHKIKTEDNPSWPFENEEVANLDKEFGLPEPIINSSGEWVLTASDIECICMGAGILGSGGGGSPHVGETMLKKFMNDGNQVRITNPFRLDPSEQGMSVFISHCGSPVVLVEKLLSGTETSTALKGMIKLLSSGVLDKTNDFGRKSDGGLEVKQFAKYPGVYEATGLENMKSLKNSDIPLDRRITSLVCFETGGLNSVAPLMLGAIHGIPVLDADGSGRAFPRHEMFAPNFYGRTKFSCCLGDNKDRAIAVSYCDSARVIEVVMRDTSVEMGSICGCVGTPLTFNEVLNNCVIYSISKAWCLGRAIQRGQLAKTDLVDSILDSVRSKLIINGKVIEISNVTKGGYDYGFMTIQGLGKFSGKTVKVLFQNENAVVHEAAADGNTDATKDNIIATTPDIIAVLDPEKGEAISNEDVRYGVKVTVVALKANPLLLTKEALEVVGPRAFGYELDYLPFSSSRGL